MIRFFRLSLVKPSAFLLGTMLLGTAAQAQAQQPNQPAQPGQPGAGAVDRRAAFESFMKSRQERLKATLGATDDEFAVLNPLIEKVKQIQISNDPRALAMRMEFMNGATAQRTKPSEDAQKNDPNAKPPEPPKAQPTPFGTFVETDMAGKVKEMSDLLQNKDTPNGVLKSKLTELRLAKKQAKDELTRAQEELRQLCTVRQEAALVMMGVLE